MKQIFKYLWIMILFITFPVNHNLYALDTVETFDKGTTDIEMYLGVDGLGKKEIEKRITSTLVFGYGIADRISAYGAMSLSGNYKFENGEASLFTGFFGTPVDTTHFDLDLMLEVNAGGENFSQFHVFPAFEINLDKNPDMESFGFYLRILFPLYNRTLIAGGQEEIADIHGVTFHIETTTGFYFTFNKIHQLFIEYTMAIHPIKKDNSPIYETGVTGVGYNIQLTDSIELITEILFNLPQRDNPFSVGVTTGFIATLF